MPLDPRALAKELLAAHIASIPVPVPPSRRGDPVDMSVAYAVEAEIARLRRASGHRTVGRKVGFANRAMWRILRLDTLAWAHMYDDTVVYAQDDAAAFAIGRRCAPRLEPEIVFRLKAPVEPGTPDPAAILGSVEWLALGFEINDCVFPDWQFAPADFVAACGLHAGLVVGTPLAIAPRAVEATSEALARFTLRLLRNGRLVEEGSGRNALRSPALCLGELANAVAKGSGDRLDAGEIVSTGTLATPQPITPGETWRAEVAGLDLPALTLTLTP